MKGLRESLNETEYNIVAHLRATMEEHADEWQTYTLLSTGDLVELGSAPEDATPLVKLRAVIQAATPLLMGPSSRYAFTASTQPLASLHERLAVLSAALRVEACIGAVSPRLADNGHSVTDMTYAWFWGDVEDMSAALKIYESQLTGQTAESVRHGWYEGTL